MNICENTRLLKETLIPLSQAGGFYPIKSSRPSVERHIRTGIKGVRLETVCIAGRRFTSTEAIDRFHQAINNANQAECYDKPQPMLESQKQV